MRDKLLPKLLNLKVFPQKTADKIYWLYKSKYSKITELRTRDELLVYPLSEIKIYNIQVYSIENVSAKYSCPQFQSVQ